MFENAYQNFRKRFHNFEIKTKIVFQICFQMVQQTLIYLK